MSGRLTPDQVRTAMRRQARYALEDRLAKKIADAGLPDPVREHRVNELRRWRFDFAWPERRLAVEVDGGVYSRGRHTRGGGYERDCEKLNAAVLDGWRVLRFTAGQIRSGYAVRTIERALER